MRFLIMVYFVLLSSWALSAAEPDISAEELPRLPTPTPAVALAAFSVRPGFRVELAAAEPNVASPVAMAFDAEGALYVVEMRDYPLPERRAQKLGTIRKLRDTDDDGVYETATTFLADLPWPTGIACAQGGVYILASPDVIFAKDTNHDGGADESRIVATGFGKEKLNVQALPNSLTWQDGKLWGATAGNGGKVNGTSLQGHDFSFDPRADTLQAEAGTAQFGLSFDESGRRFVCSNSHHLQWVPWEMRHGGKLSPPPNLLLDIPVDGPAATVYRTSAEESWRVVRTRWRATGQVSGLVEGGGRSSGYFTSACGLLVFRGDAFPAEFAENVFICDVGSNLVHRKILREKNGELLAERSVDEAHREFLTSQSNWFRPVACATGPDGALYVADMAREIIEHPDSLPNNIKQHLDLANGAKLGRIWRVVPESWPRPKRPLPGRVSPADWVALLDHPNVWHRETAQRLLFETNDPSILPLLHRSASALTLPLLAKHSALTTADVQRVWASQRPAHQRRSVRWLHPLFPAEQDAALVLAQEMAASSDPFVLSELPSALASAPTAARLDLLLKLFRTEIPHVQQAVTLAPNTPEEALQLALKTRAVACWEMVGKSHQASVIHQATTFLASQQPLPLAELAALGIAPTAPMLAFAKQQLTSGQASDAALALVLKATPPDFATSLACLRNAALPAPFRARFVPGLDAATMELLLPEWAKLPIPIRQAGLEWFLRTSTRAAKLLTLLTTSAISKTELSADQINQARRLHPQETNALFGQPQDRQQVINQHLAALTLPGLAQPGELIFTQRCLVCHQHREAGNAVGPERKTFRNLGKPSLLVNILDPNRDVAAAYQLVTIITNNGETQAGLLASENAETVTIKTALGQTQTLPRATISKLEPSRRSLMPEGLEQGLTDQELAHLLEFLIQP